MKLLFLLLLCVMILSQLVWSPSFDISFYGSSSIAIASFVERLFKKHSIYLFIYLLNFRKYLDRRIVYSDGHHGTLNQAVLTNKEDMQISRRVLSVSSLRLWRITPSSICIINSSYYTQPRPIIANYTALSSRQIMQANSLDFGLFIVIIAWYQYR